MTVTLPASPVLLIGGGLVSAAATLLYLLVRLGRLLVTRLRRDPVLVIIMEAIGLIGVVGWIQSFISLRALALIAAEPEWEADIWPAVLDTFALAMGLAALRARALKRQDAHADWLAGIYSALAVIGNLGTALVVLQSEGQTNWLIVTVTICVRGLAPLTMLVGFHWLMHELGKSDPEPEPAPQYEALPPVVVTTVEEAVLVATTRGVVAPQGPVAALLAAHYPDALSPAPQVGGPRPDEPLPRQGDEVRDEAPDEAPLITVTRRLTSDEPQQTPQPDDVPDEDQLVTVTRRGAPARRAEAPQREEPGARQEDEPERTLVVLRRTTTTSGEAPDSRAVRMARLLLREPGLSNVKLAARLKFSASTADRLRPAANRELARLQAEAAEQEGQPAEA